MKIDFRLVGGEEKWTKRSESNSSITDSWPIVRMDGESELDFCHRKAIAYAKSVINDDYHGMTREEFESEYNQFTDEWKKVIDNDPIIGKN